MTKRIFIVDDDPFWTNILFRLLTDLGYNNVVKFSNGTDCLANLHLNPGLVFLDYQMEDMDGLELLPKIKSYFPGIGVIFCTAHENIQVAVNAMKQGSYDYLLKHNINKKTLGDAIEAVNLSQNQPDRIY